MIRPLTSSPKHHFFGFHDVCPWDATSRYILAHETDFIDRPPRAADVARICVIDTRNSNALRVVGETRAWNFHQGARLQWIPGKKNKIIYNDRRRDERGLDKFVSVILDIETGEEKVLGYPIYAVSPGGTFGLGLNFSRLQKYGGYGYSQEIKNLEEPYPKDDGIWRVDFKTGEVKLTISIYDVAHTGNILLENEHHLLTHIVFNPGGMRICFGDKYRLPDGGFDNRFFTADPDGKNLYCVPVHISHFDWRDDKEILGYGKFSPKIIALRKAGFLNNPLLKPLLNIARKLRGGLKQKIAGQSYLLFTDRTQNVQRVGVGVMTEDGHPQFSPDGKWVITDTYADRNHERTLVLYDWEKKKRIDLGKFYSLPVDGKEIILPNGKKEYWDISQMRADLHPRWNRDGTKVCIDSVHEGTRQMYVVDINKIVA